MPFCQGLLINMIQHWWPSLFKMELDSASIAESGIKLDWAAANCCSKFWSGHCNFLPRDIQRSGFVSAILQ
jgi:hypothetical protein